VTVNLVNLFKYRPRNNAAVIAIPVLGAAVALTGTAFAAGESPTPTTPRTRTAVECTQIVAVPAPAAPIATKTYSAVGAAGINAELPAIPTVNGLKVTQARAEVTLQFFSGTSGRATLRLPGREYHSAIRFEILPNTKVNFYDPNRPVPFSAFTTSGNATVKITASIFAAATTKAQSHVVAGGVCPSGEQVTTVIDANSPAASPTPTPTLP
jgi:hypothetical protein